ncbi:MAG: hypothetical protein IPJ19_05935 [Planctomycetes bacterium]|nr:hypothetical protein [Planctomycetota bacterium]
MSRHAIRTSPSSHRARRGNALLGTLIVLVALLGLLYATSRVSVVEVHETRSAVEDVQSKYLAEAGVERALNFLAQTARAGSQQDPLRGLHQLFATSDHLSPFVAEPLTSGLQQVGAYSVSLRATEQNATSITIAIDATGYRPEAPQSLAAGQHPSTWSAVRTIVRYSLAPSHVFDYGYFINNWGWFYGSTITCNGNVRSNGQFDVAGYSPTITGQPLYDAVSWNGTQATLSGYHDDNGDGLLDGNDGGLWSSWDITGAQHLQGNGGHAQNQHDFQDPIPMPNLSDLGMYEANAVDQHSSITIDGVQVANAVVGDEPGEKQNLYLVGTSAKPIVLNGPVVVRGNLIISGVVTGQGAIYSGGNVYCPNSVTYKNPPSAPRPANGSQAANEAWLSTNWNKDFLGLFARENIVVGDFTNSTWQSYVSQWMGDAMNVSAEDCGADGIPNTRAGKDGILGTADDDVLEGDGLFSVQHYTQADADLGLLPAGAHVGDVIPGSGEDIDGDGAFDGQASLANVILTTPLDAAHWSGNMPAAGLTNYRSIASMNAATLDAVFYTNHSFCWTVLGSQVARINGALVSRNEDIVYGTPSLEFNYDCRLLGGSSGRAARLLPQTLQSPEILRWSPLDSDPNKDLVLP